jgi:hypothetical protein
MHEDVVMHYFSKAPIPTLSALIMIVLSPSAIATTTNTAIIRPNAGQPYIPTCYVQFPGQSAQNLDRLCGITTQRNRQKNLGTIDLSIDANGDGVPDQLLAHMQRLRAAMTQAKNAQERATLRRQFESQLPYSDQVRQLQAQRRTLQEQRRQATNPSQQQEISRQIRTNRQQMRQDPTYQTVRQQMRRINRPSRT